jgi:hypothetical protein
MENERADADYFARRAAEYRGRVRAIDDPGVRSALEAVARDFMRKARKLEPAVPRMVGIQ